MSNYQQINGSWDLPKKEVGPLLKKLANMHNQIRDQALSIADRSLKESKDPHVFAPQMSEDVEGMVQTMLKNAKKRAAKPTKITEKDFPKANSKTSGYTLGFDASLSIDGNNISIYADNNHVQESMNSSPVSKVLHRHLAGVKWTPKTGGYLNYTDEYAQDAAMEYGNNPITLIDVYGPIGEKEEEYRNNGFSHTKEKRIKDLSSYSTPANRRLCGKIMPRANVRCEAKAGHKGPCRRK